MHRGSDQTACEVTILRSRETSYCETTSSVHFTFLCAFLAGLAADWPEEEKVMIMIICYVCHMNLNIVKQSLL